MNVILIIINDAPYGSEKAYNALRLAMTLQKNHPGTGVRLFLLADGVFCGIPGQKTPDGFYNIERMLKSVISRGGEVKACGGCSDARGIGTLTFIEGVEMSNMNEFAEWVSDSVKVLTF